VADDHHPGLAAMVAGEPVECHVRDGRGVIFRLDLTPLAVHVELGIEIPALPLVGDEVVVPGPRLVVVLPHVVLADVGGRVTGALQALWKIVDPRVELGEVVRDPMLVGIEPAQQRRPARRTQRRRRERVPEIDSFPGEPIDVGGPHMRVAGIAQRVGAKIVEQDEEDVRPALDRRSHRRNWLRFSPSAGRWAETGQEKRGEKQPAHGETII
jgi:hypothetical protein